MSRRRPAPSSTPALTTDDLQTLWADLNGRYFDHALPPIEIAWSRRLTVAAGMFSSRGGPRVNDPAACRRLIRLSAPLLREQPNADLVGTLAHEMIHQWQFDLLKRRPNHGPDFRRKMDEMNRDGLGITVRHNLEDAVLALAKYAWRCLGCGKIYHRRRRTIRPGRHRCGSCRGLLRETAPTAHRPTAAPTMPPPPIVQMELNLDGW
ncbi:MAG: M48 family peptidase [Nitrospirae bacterium]|nr:MAG: M48 family peptidase [Nitrospirota bacterium]